MLFCTDDSHTYTTTMPTPLSSKFADKAYPLIFLL